MNSDAFRGKDFIRMESAVHLRHVQLAKSGRNPSILIHAPGAHHSFGAAADMGPILRLSDAPDLGGEVGHDFNQAEAFGTVR